MLKQYDFINIEDYRKLKMIGRGAFGCVYRIQHKSSGEIFAAKIFQELFQKDHDSDSNLETKQMQIEASIYSRLKFPSIVKFYGVSSTDFDDEPFPLLILEYIPNGSLKDALNNEKIGNSPFQWNDTKKLINLYGIASGVAYLHSQNILYRDLKPDNVLEDENYYPKLSDFGISTFYEVNKAQIHTANSGTPIYMAPEVFQFDDDNHAPYSTPVDVYSFGMLAYEMMTGRQPFHFIKKPRDFYEAIRLQKRPEFDDQFPKCYRELITKCWSQKPEDRPTFSEIIEILKNDRDFITELDDVDEDEYYKYIEYISQNGEQNEEEKDDQSESFEEEIEEDLTPLSINVQSFDLNTINKLNIIGEGSFGVVYEVKDKNTNEIYAAKVSKSEIYECLKNDDVTINLIREILILSKLNHPSIMKFIGFSPVNFKSRPKPVIVTELLKNGTLEDLLELERKGLSCKEWNDTKKLINIYGIASSMKYLHSLDILHRDLKPSNILVDEYLFPKLSDFGLSKDIKTKMEDCERLKATGLLGTPIYISPEIYESYKYSKPGDVYAFGLIVYEIVTTNIPSIGRDQYQIINNLNKGFRPIIDSNVPDCYVKLIESCWDQDPLKRPSFHQIVDTLRNDQSFISDLINEGEYLDYIDMIDHQNENQSELKTIELTSQKIQHQKQQDILQKASKLNGFIDLNQFDKNEKLWKSTFWNYYNVIERNTGTVYCAKMSTIIVDNFSEEEINGLKKEVSILTTMNHPSLLKFYGYSFVNFKNERKPIVIIELPLKQTLENIIELKQKNIKSEEWNETKILIIAIGIASGMSYLHSKGILHNDLRPSNVFVDKNLYPKISDFGTFTKIQIAKSMSIQSLSKMKNEPNYSAPEVLNNNKQIKESDVYSFAMILFELITKEKPFNKLKNSNQIVNEIVNKGKRPEFPNNKEEKVSQCYKELIEKCWSQNPSERPSFDEIVDILKNDKRFLTEKVDKDEYFSYIESIIDSSEPLKSETKPKIVEIEENNELNKSENYHSVNNDEQINIQKVVPKNEVEKNHQKIDGTNSISISSNQNDSIIQKVEEIELNKYITSPTSENPSHHKSSIKTDQLSPKPFSQQPPKPLPPKLSSSSNASTEFQEIYNEIRDNSNNTNWVLFNFDGAHKKWNFSGKGAGGLDQMKTEIGNDFIGYGFIRVPSRSSAIKRDVFIKFKFVSKSAKMMTKAIMNARRSEIDEAIKYYNFSIEASSIDELSDEISKCINK